MQPFAFAVFLHLVIAASPCADPLPPGARVRLGTTRFHHSDPIRWVCCGASGRTVLTAEWDGLRIWDAISRKRLAKFDGAAWVRYSFALAADRKRLVVTSNSGQELRVIHLPSGKEIRRLAYEALCGPEARRLFVANFGLSADGRHLAVWDNANAKVVFPDGKRKPPFLHVWDLDRGLRIQEITTGTLFGVEFTPDGKRVVALEGHENDEKRRLRAWDTQSGKELSLVEPPRPLSRFVFLPDGKSFLGLSIAGDLLALYDTATGNELRAIGDKAPISTFTVSTDGKIVAVAQGMRLTVRGIDDDRITFDMPFSLDASNLGTMEHPIIDVVAFSPDGKTLAVADARKLTLWNLDTQTRLYPDDSLAGGVLAVHRHGHHVLIRDMDMDLSLWDLRTGKLVRRFVGEPIKPSNHGPYGLHETLHCAVGLQAISSDGQRVAAVWPGGPIYVFNLASGKRMLRLEGSEKATCLALSPDGKLLAAPTVDGQISTWNTTTGKSSQRFSPSRKASNRKVDFLGLRFTADGRQLVGSTFGAVDNLAACEFLIWECASGSLRSRVNAGDFHHRGSHPDGFSQIDRLENVALEFVTSTNGKHVAAAGPRTIRLWDVEGNREVRRFGGRDVIGHSAAFSPDGKYLVAGLDSGGIHFWNTQTGTVVRDVPAHTLKVTSLSFADQGRTLVSGSLDGTAIAWEVDRLLSAAPPGHADLEALWTTLGQPDAEKAAQAMLIFTARPQETLALLRKRLRPIPLADPKRVDRLLADLRSDDYDVRQYANEELEQLGGRARAALEKLLDTGLDLETRRRVEELLQRLEPPILDSALLRGIRAVELLERIGTADARALVETIAAGGGGHRLTEDARQVLDRMPKQSGK